MRDDVVGDVRLTCIECGEAWTLGERERQAFVQAGLRVPKRCAPCRAARRKLRADAEAQGIPYEEWSRRGSR